MNPKIKQQLKKTIILIPTYNERENIEILIQAINQQLPGVMIMVMDDTSPDGTGDYVEKLAKKNKKIFYLGGGRKEGIGKAYIRGFKKSLELSKKIPIDYIVQMDADYSHDPAYIPQMFTDLEGKDLVIGSRYHNGVNVVNWPMKRVLLSYFANRYVNWVTGVKLDDVTGGYKIFRRSALEQINLDEVVSNGYVFQIEMNYIFRKMNFKITESSIIFKDRKIGESKISFDIIREAMIRVLFFPFKNINKYRK